MMSLHILAQYVHIVLLISNTLLISTLAYISNKQLHDMVEERQVDIFSESSKHCSGLTALTTYLWVM